MRAWQRDRFGVPDVLRLVDVPDPVPTADDVLVRVRYASLNRADIDYLTARPAISRVVAGMRRPATPRVGLDAAGEVVAVGSNVTRLRIGDRVLSDLTGYGMGAFAELAKAPERAWHRIPAEVSLRDASTLPESAMLAYQGLRSLGGARPGQRVLINGASGCVGPFAVQLAKAAGAHVTGVARGDKLDLVRSLGADEVIDRRREDVTRSGRRFDLVLDSAGTRSVFAWRRVLAPGGRYATFGSPSTARILQTFIGGALLSAIGSRRLGLMTAWKPDDPQDMAEVLRLVQAGTLRPVIDREVPLEDVPDAYRRMIAGDARGKLVIAVDP
jgi:NADPH:quinone reductase-like Zn-dependent oxidoreductase